MWSALLVALILLQPVLTLGPARAHLGLVIGGGQPGLAAALLGGRSFVGLAEPFDQADLIAIRQAGFDGVRYYFGRDAVQDEAGNLRPDGVGRLDWLLDQAGALGLRVILDLHTIEGWDGPFYQQPEAIARWQRLWLDLAQRYRERPRSVLAAYELLNEPNPVDRYGKKASPAAQARWQALAQDLVDRLRALDSRPLVVGPANYSNPEMFAGLSPLAARDIVYSVHYYQPYPFTLQGTSAWATCRGVAYDYPGAYGDCAGAAYGGYWDRARLRESLRDVARFQQTYGVPVMVGEWDYGWANTAPPAGGLRLIADAVGVFGALGLPHAWHHWGGSYYHQPGAELLSWHDGQRLVLAHEKLRAMGLG